MYYIISKLEAQGDKFYGGHWWNEVVSDIDLTPFVGKRCQVYTKLTDNSRVSKIVQIAEVENKSLPTYGEYTFLSNILQEDGSMKWALVQDDGCCGFQFYLDELQDILNKFHGKY